VAAYSLEAPGLEATAYPAASGQAVRPGLVGAPSNPVFTPSLSGSYVRGLDAEYKLLEDAAARLGSNFGVTGRLVLFTEKPPCASCFDVIQQFKARYPGIELHVINGS
jgi:The  BURPS668_1122 family of deaminases